MFAARGDLDGGQPFGVAVELQSDPVLTGRHAVELQRRLPPQAPVDVDVRASGP